MLLLCPLMWKTLCSDENRYYKSIILKTNFRNPAQTLMKKENIRLTISMLLDGCFTVQHPGISRIFRDITKTCPVLVSAINSNSMEDQESELHIGAQGDRKHYQPRAFHKCKSKTIITDMVGFKRACDAKRNSSFAVALESAYCTDYDLMVFPYLEKTKLQWSQKVSFAPRSAYPINIP